MAKGKEGRPPDLVVEAVADVDVLAVEDATTLGTVVQEGGVVFKAVRERKGEFPGLRT